MTDQKNNCEYRDLATQRRNNLVLIATNVIGTLGFALVLAISQTGFFYH